MNLSSFRITLSHTHTAYVSFSLKTSFSLGPVACKSVLTQRINQSDLIFHPSSNILHRHYVENSRSFWGRQHRSGLRCREDALSRLRGPLSSGRTPKKSLLTLPQVVFVDVMDSIIESLQKTPEYTVTEIGTEGEKVNTITNYRAINSKYNAEDVVEEISKAEIVGLRCFVSYCPN